MTDGDRVPPFVEALVRAVAGGSPEDRDERASTFARGLALGALVGAAIAGSTIWQRRHAQARGGRDAVASRTVGAETSDTTA
jgi:NhaP-type Na+/H+ or K+/H+ antiporter